MGTGLQTNDYKSSPMHQAHARSRRNLHRLQMRSGAVAYLTLTPLRVVYILAAMFMLASSWKSNLAAYGM